MGPRWDYSNGFREGYEAGYRRAYAVGPPELARPLGALRLRALGTTATATAYAAATDARRRR